VRTVEAPLFQDDVTLSMGKMRVPRLAEARKKESALDFSVQDALGSPPPELPNHEIDIRALLEDCKRHFGNEVSGELCERATGSTVSPAPVSGLVLRPFVACSSLLSRPRLAPLGQAQGQLWAVFFRHDLE